MAHGQAERQDSQNQWWKIGTLSRQEEKWLCPVFCGLIIAVTLDPEALAAPALSLQQTLFVIGEERSEVCLKNSLGLI